MANLSNLVFAYFVIGAVMWGGGALTFEEAGVITSVVTMDNGNVGVNESFSREINKQDSIIGGVVTAFGAGLLIVWNMIFAVLKFIHWPLTTLIQAHAPPQVTVLLGGGMTLSFYMAIARMVSRAS